MMPEKSPKISQDDVDRALFEMGKSQIVDRWKISADGLSYSKPLDSQKEYSAELRAAIQTRAEQLIKKSKQPVTFSFTDSGLNGRMVFEHKHARDADGNIIENAAHRRELSAFVQSFGDSMFPWRKKQEAKAQQGSDMTDQDKKSHGDKLRGKRDWGTKLPPRGEKGASTAPAGSTITSEIIAKGPKKSWDADAIQPASDPNAIPNAWERNKGHGGDAGPSR